MDGRPRLRPWAAERGAAPVPAVVPDLGRAGYASGLALAAAIALALRLQRVLAADFPLHDGGLIYTMVRDLQAAGFRLPVHSSYNGGQVPFAYPPLALYLAAALDRLTPASTLDVLRFLPLAFSLLTVAAFALLARSLLPTRGAALVATLLFAAYSEAFAWFIMGGGLPRSLGLSFALLSLLWLHRLYREGRPALGWAAGVAGGLSLLSHVEMAWFLGLSGLVLFLVEARSPAALRGTALAALVAVAVSAPWWGTVLARYGPDTLPAPGESRALFSVTELSWVFTYHLGESHPFTVIFALAMLGALTSLLQGGRWLVLWLAAGAFAAPWLFPRLTGLPLHLLGGLGWWRLTRPWGTGAAAVGAGALAVALTVVTAAGPLPIVEPLSRGAREAMGWAAANTPPDARFLVVENRSWWDNVAAEWLPALSGRLSAVTPQGLEWVPGAFVPRRDAYESLQQCAEQGVECLGLWEAETGIAYDYVFVSKEVPYHLRRQGYQDCCGPLRDSLRQSLLFETVYDGAGASIFRRLP